MQAILKLDVSGQPRGWLTLNEAVTAYARGDVLYGIGESLPPVFGGIQGAEGAAAGGSGTGLMGDGVAVLLELLMGEEEDGGSRDGLCVFAEGVCGRAAAAYGYLQLGVVGEGHLAGPVLFGACRKQKEQSQKEGIAQRAEKTAVV